VLTAERARMLGLDPGRHAGLSLPIPADATADQLLPLATEQHTGAAPPATKPATCGAVGALSLAKAGQLVPAVIVAEAGNPAGDTLQTLLNEQTILSVDCAQAIRLGAEGETHLLRISEGSVPLREADSRFILFREDSGLREHVAILIGDRQQWHDPVPVRLHSACLTGDLFDSLRCDCGPQLRGSVRTIQELGGGVLLYLAQEGRGIGLANKLRAYTMQDRGLDTMDADRTLGFSDDERRYELAVQMLESINVRRVRLLTNNPRKVEALKHGGIEVPERQPMHGEVTAENHRYLTSKAERAGHWLNELLAASKPPK